MGLTIHYGLHSNTRSVLLARSLVDKLRQAALDLPFESVSELIELTGDGCNYHERSREDPHRWLLIQAREMVQLDDQLYEVAPQHLITFETNPGAGCEPANMGLALYPATIVLPNGQRKRTGLAGWCWSSFCKTQYSSDPNAGGVENFLRCHMSVIALLDQARTLGIVSSVSDESGFWDKRDVRELAQVVGTWNEFIAGLAGKLMDQFGKGVVAEIAKFPNFEHLLCSQDRYVA